jgi:phenylacetate-CoA ligase
LIESLRTWLLLRELRATRSPEELARLQDDLLRSAVARAASIPFYGELWAQQKFDPASFGGLVDLARLPVVGAEAARAALERLSSRVSYATSGTSGRPVSVPRGAADQRVWRAVGLRIWLEHGFRWSDVTLRFDSQAAPSHPLQRFGLSRTLWISNELPLEERLDRLLSAGARIVVGTPTVLRQVCSVLESRGIRPARPRVVFVQGEVCDARTRASIARTFGVEPVELYGLTEVGYVAWQCERREALHVNADAYVVEVLEGGVPVAPGHVGRVVVTDLRGRTMPLLRYDTGDLALAADGPCPCGRPLPLLGRMEGRASASIMRRDGTLVPTRAIVDGVGEILSPERFRLRQDADRRIWLDLAADAGDEIPAAALVESVIREPLAGITRTLPEPSSNAEKTHPIIRDPSGTVGS